MVKASVNYYMGAAPVKHFKQPLDIIVLYWMVMMNDRLPDLSSKFHIC